MKKSILTLVTVITATAAGTSLFLATLSNPTDVQRGLSNTANAVTFAGTTAIFGLLNDEDEDNSTDH